MPSLGSTMLHLWDSPPSGHVIFMWCRYLIPWNVAHESKVSLVPRLGTRSRLVKSLSSSFRTGNEEMGNGEMWKWRNKLEMVVIWLETKRLINFPDLWASYRLRLSRHAIWSGIKDFDSSSYLHTVVLPIIFGGIDSNTLQIIVKIRASPLMVLSQIFGQVGL